MCSLDSYQISVAARSSALSRAQVEEVLFEIRKFNPNIYFNSTWVETSGDKDLISSLRSMEKTDFFTKEIDQILLDGKCRIAIHSAKDLPIPLREGLSCAAITKGVDSADSLVFRDNESLSTLKENAKIGTSSIRREEMIKFLRSDLQCRDIRGTIHHRLDQLDKGLFDGVIIAEAAIIRLNLVQRNRIKLDGPVAEFQGQLAVIVRENDQEMLELFSKIDVAKDLLVHKK